MAFKKALSISSVLIFCAVTFAATSTETAAESAKQTSQSPAGDLKWNKTDLGVEVSPVYGDMSKGQHITFVKFSAGQKTPVHTHSADYVGVVVAGTGRHHEPGKPETQKDLPVGSHWAVPAEVEHISECLPGGECVFAIYQQAPFDFKAVDKK